MRFKTSVLQSDLCDYSDAYVVVKGTITVKGDEKKTEKNRSVAFKNNAPFIGCISKVNNVLIENAEDLDIVMPMYNLIEYSKSYRKTTGSLLNHYRDELSDETNDNNSPNKKVVKSNLLNSKLALQEVVLITMLMKKLPMQMVIKLIILFMMQIKLTQKKLKFLFH